MYAQTIQINESKKAGNCRRSDASKSGLPSRTMVHAKLEMTEPGDADEREADTMASDIVSGGKIRREVSSGFGSGSGIAVSPQMESQLSQLQGGGHSMPDGLRSMMESGFGRDFSQVRLHTDEQAADMSRSIHAKAFTLGNDIYFNRGQFSPSSTEGQRLVAHELTHVAQDSEKIGRDVDMPLSSATEQGGMSTEEWNPGTPDTTLLDESKVKMSKSLSRGVSGFNADNVAMIGILKKQKPKIKTIEKLEKDILKVASPATPEELEMPDDSEQDLMDIEEERVSTFNKVKDGMEHAKKDRQFAQKSLDEAVENFQMLGEAVANLSDLYDEHAEYLVQLKAYVEAELTKAANMLRFEVSDRWGTIYVNSEKVIYGLQLLRETKDNAIFFVRWTAAPSEKELDKVDKNIEQVKPDVEEIKQLNLGYQQKIISGQENHQIPFESFAALSHFAEDYNTKVQMTGQKIFNIDNSIYELREGAISSAENWVTALKIISEVCITVSTSFIPGAGAARAAAWAVKGAKLAKAGNVLHKAANFNKATKLVSSTLSGTATNVAGKSMELGLKKLSNTITGEQVFDLKEWDKELGKSAISGAFSGFASGAFKLAAETPNVGMVGKAANKIMDFEKGGKHIAISGEGLAGGVFGLTGDKLANILLNENHDAQWSVWDCTAALGGLKIKSVKTMENADHLKGKEFELAEARIMERQNALHAKKSSLTDRNKIDKNLSEEIQLADEISRLRKEHAEFLSQQHDILKGKRNQALAKYKENQGKLTETVTKRRQLEGELDALTADQKNLSKKEFAKKSSSLKKEIKKLTRTKNKLQKEMDSNSAKAKDYTKQFDDNLSKEIEYASPVGQTDKADSLQKYKEFVNAKYNNDDFGINTGRKYLLRWGDEDGTGPGINEDLLSSVVNATLSNENFQNLFGNEDVSESGLQYEYRPMQEVFRFNTCFDYETHKHFRVFFNTGKSEIDTDGMDTIGAITGYIEAMKRYGHIRIQVIGQASPRWMVKKDESEGMEKNDKLALERAGNVREALLEHLDGIGINRNEIDSTILLQEETQTADMTYKEEIENRYNLAGMRSVIIIISRK